jgi:hypothetical protein
VENGSVSFTCRRSHDGEGSKEGGQEAGQEEDRGQKEVRKEEVR